MFDPARFELTMLVLSILGGLFVIFSVWLYTLLHRMAEYRASKTTCWKNLDVVKEQGEESMERLRELTKKLDP